MNRRKKLYLNTGTALLNQLVILVCGFILPRYILSYFGSDVNGLVTSITRFLSVISFLELGVGPVIQSNLYKPLAEKDSDAISKIVVSSEKFYRRIAYIFLIYIAVLIFIFPRFNSEYDFVFTVSLLVIISISTFAQYYFGITYQVFLNADQKVYVQSSLQIITVILNTIISIILMKLGFGIHVVKLASTIVYFIRPLAQYVYVRRNYKINHKIKYSEEPIKQKWNGFAQHLAAVVCGEIDVVLLTLFASYQSISIYSVYLLVVSGITNLIMTSVSGLEAFWGNMIAKKEYSLLQKTFESMECLIHTGVTFLFVSTAILITPFVSIYTMGVKDTAAYYVPVFGMMLAFGYATQCLRVPYFRIIKAAGHYKETQNGAFISMILNIVISVILVFKFQLVGGALGTIVAMLYHTVYFAWYLRNSILHRKFYHFIKHMVVDVVAGIISFIVTNFISMGTMSYMGWIIYAVKIAAIVGIITGIINITLYRNEFAYLVKKVLNKA